MHFCSLFLFVCFISRSSTSFLKKSGLINWENCIHFHVNVLLPIEYCCIFNRWSDSVFSCIGVAPLGTGSEQDPCMRCTHGQEPILCRSVEVLWRSHWIGAQRRSGDNLSDLHFQQGRSSQALKELSWHEIRGRRVTLSSYEWRVETKCRKDWEIFYIE